MKDYADKCCQEVDMQKHYVVEQMNFPVRQTFKFLEYLILQGGLLYLCDFSYNTYSFQCQDSSRTSDFIVSFELKFFNKYRDRAVKM